MASGISAASSSRLLQSRTALAVTCSARPRRRETVKVRGPMSSEEADAWAAHPSQRVVTRRVHIKNGTPLRERIRSGCVLEGKTASIRAYFKTVGLEARRCDGTNEHHAQHLRTGRVLRDLRPGGQTQPKTDSARTYSQRTRSRIPRQPVLQELSQGGLSRRLISAPPYPARRPSRWPPEISPREAALISPEHFGGAERIGPGKVPWKRGPDDHRTICAWLTNSAMGSFLASRGKPYSLFIGALEGDRN